MTGRDQSWRIEDLDFGPGCHYFQSKSNPLNLLLHEENEEFEKKSFLRYLPELQIYSLNLLESFRMFCHLINRDTVKIKLDRRHIRSETLSILSLL